MAQSPTAVLSPTSNRLHPVDADLTHGLPVSLQLVARRLEEEKALAMCRCVLEALGQ